MNKDVYAIKLSDLCVGFEYCFPTDYYYADDPKEILYVHSVINNAEDLIEVIKTYVYDNDKIDLVAKYLDKEDIESLGFKYHDSWYNLVIPHTTSDGEYFDINGNFISFPYYSINIYDEVIIIGNPNGETIFNGNIKNKYELKKLLKQLNIC